MTIRAAAARQVALQRRGYAAAVLRAQDRLDIRSYIDTIRKHGAGVMVGIRAALAGNPWHPPALAPT